MYLHTYTTLPYLPFPYLTFPSLTLPYLPFPYLTFPSLTLPSLPLPYLPLPYLPLPYLPLPYLNLNLNLNLNLTYLHPSLSHEADVHKGRKVVPPPDLAWLMVAEGGEARQTFSTIKTAGRGSPFSLKLIYNSYTRTGFH